MSLTFRSSTPEERVIIERGRDGSQRVCRAIQSDHNPKFWNITEERPSGMVTKATFHGDGHTVQVAMTQILMDSEHAYRQEAARGHRPPPPDRDYSQRVDEHGNNIAAPITQRR